MLTCAPAQVEETPSTPGLGWVGCHQPEVGGSCWKSDRNGHKGRPGRAGPRWFLLRKQGGHSCTAASLSPSRTITVTQLAALPVGCGETSPTPCLPKPAPNHMSPCGLPPLPQAGRQWLLEGPEPSGVSSETQAGQDPSSVP